ncbi:hypothetical protein EZI54_07415 [Marinobacter halodurans]|uniref:Uncharacterized protein n=1 Tax=Marinobacter halodurans TaxID=2528979 RepID=A0ABY1ZPG1_9GAMM|nr:hypothetical protein [Marinobacter halodurans]TBW57480.1 hypothetical protein EZI54_07415 [Marinobacter halodurans]
MLVTAPDANAQRDRSQRQDGTRFFAQAQPHPALTMLTLPRFERGSDFISATSDLFRYFRPDRASLANTLMVSHALGATSTQNVNNIIEDGLKEIVVWQRTCRDLSTWGQRVSLAEFSVDWTTTIPLRAIASHAIELAEVGYTDRSTTHIAVCDLYAVEKQASTVPPRRILKHVETTAESLCKHLTGPGADDPAVNQLDVNFRSLLGIDSSWPGSFIRDDPVASSRSAFGYVQPNDMTAYCMTPITGKLTTAQREAFLQALELINLYLRPCSTPVDLLEFAAFSFDEIEAEIEQLHEELDVTDLEAANFDKLEEAIEKSGDYMMCCDAETALFYQSLYDDMRVAKDYWSVPEVATLNGNNAISRFCRKVGGLKKLGAEGEDQAKILEWLAETAEVLAPYNGSDNTILDVTDMPNQLAETLVLLPSDEEETEIMAPIRDNLDGFSEMVMSDPDERRLELDWNLPLAELLALRLRFLEGAQLIAKL